MKTLLREIALCLFLISTSELMAQQKPASVSVGLDEIKAKPGETVFVDFIVKLRPGWHTFPQREQINADGIGPMASTISVEPADLVSIIGKVADPKGHVEMDKGFEINIEQYERKVTFKIPVKISKNAKKGEGNFKIIGTFQLCDSTTCLPADDFKASVKLIIAESGTDTSQSAVAAPGQSENPIDGSAAEVSKNTKETKPMVNHSAIVTDAQKEIDSAQARGTFYFLLFAMIAGAGALTTPCVYPMIPITVSFFTKRDEQRKVRAIRDAVIFALGIMSTFVLFGLIAAILQKGTVAGDFAANPWVNLALAGLFLVFAFNLFGSFEIQVPSFLLNKLHAQSNKTSGVLGVFLMGITFSLTSFTCTVSFVGNALSSAGKGDFFYPILGMIGFSFVFALPFLLLALAPSALQRLPKSGGWMNNIKVILGFIEIAFAFSYLSRADTTFDAGLFSREAVLAIWAACGLLIVLYMIGSYKMTLDSDLKHVGGIRAGFAVLFAGATIYLGAGIFGNNIGPFEAYIYSEPSTVRTLTTSNIAAQSEGGTEYTGDWILDDYERAIAIAKKENKNVFIDFTGFNCSNCIWMEKNMFIKPTVDERMKKFVRVRLHTDRRTEPYISYKTMQQEKYQSIELPMYAVVRPDEQVVATASFNRDEQSFMQFLKKGLE